MTDFEPIAVVGMAGVFPDAADLDAFWTLIRDRRSAAAPAPPDRWIIPPASVVQSEPAPDKAFSDRACLVRDFTFDPSGFALDADLLRPLDPLYHLTLHAGRAAVSGCRMALVDPSRVAVTLAAIALPTDASSRLTRELFGRAFAERLFGPGTEGTPNFSLADKLSARVTSLPAALLARALGFGGGSMTLDAACASSLYAVKLACDALRSGRADAVVAGGVSRPECLYTQIGFSQLRALSPSGRCAPFDARADGLVVGEGAGILVLKRLSDALAHGDAVHGIVRAVGLSNDMRGNLLSPEADGQVRAMRAAYAAAGWTPDQVDHVECHGTGTPVGDGIELKSLHQIREGTPGELGGTPIGSVKSNVGHLLTGAGAAGLIKTLLAMRRQTLPPSANFQQAAENSPLRSGPFRVQTEAAPWETPSDRPRRAAVSAFGFGGINAHLLVEEFQEPICLPAKRKRVPASPPEPVAIVGMDVRVGTLDGIREFQEALFNGRPAFVPRPPERWHGADGLAGRVLDGAGMDSSEHFGELGAPNPPKSPYAKIKLSRANHGAYREAVSIRPGEFGVPPREIPDILPQQLLILQAASGALKDAGISGREPRPKAGVIVGMDFDPEACGFHLRWSLENRIAEWLERTGTEDTADGEWLSALRDACGPPLTATRTLGALGGVVASRVAREFRLGGPSYTVSAEAAGGLRALEIAVRSLQARETDLYIAGAVDLAGDLRNVAATGLREFGTGDGVQPFDRSANGHLPGDGAAALVLKRLSDAKADGDRIYAVVRGLGFAGGDDIASSAPDANVYARSLTNALRDAAAAPETVGLVAAHGGGEAAQDRSEADAIREVLGDGREAKVALTSAAAIAGSSGAAGGMISVASAALCL
ncbi:MAG: polyketide synthase, partial [Desulfococcaceae bacterium]